MEISSLPALLFDLREAEDAGSLVGSLGEDSSAVSSSEGFHWMIGWCGGFCVLLSNQVRPRNLKLAGNACLAQAAGGRRVL